MGNKIKAIREALDAIANDRQKFHFTVSSTKALEGRDKVVLFNRDEGANFKVKGEILGRKEEQREIIENYLLKPDGDMIISIVGSGGLGKTTLARLIFDDDELKKHFDLRMWVSVGYINFNVDEIAEKAIKSTIEKKEKQGDNIGENVEDEETKKFRKLKSGILEVEGERKKTFPNLIQNKKFLLLLDDVWNEDRNKWNNLENLWQEENYVKGSRVLLTTRSSIVAEMTGSTLEPYRLGYLSLEHSKSLFKKIVFGDKEPLNPSVEENVEKIVEKCDGVPLAIKTIGNLLYFLNPETEWLPYVTNEISKYPTANNNIFLTLQLSYHHLPSPLKYCFAYCKIFPKGYEIDVETLIQLWIAQAYIRASIMGDQSLEDIGMQNCEMLLRRSFFQDEELDVFGIIKSLKMHDIMHELSSYVGSEDIVYSNQLGNDVNKNTHHFSYERDFSWSLSQHLDSLLEARKLRTFISVETKDISISSKDMIETRQCNKMFKKLKSLLVLDLQGSRSKYDDDEEWFLKAAVTSCIIWAIRDQVLKSISKLKHLRYLDLSFTNVKELPESITKLQNLRVLKMVDCDRLRKLPKNIKKLINLQILDCEGCDKLTYMPRGLQNLTALHTLTKFVVAKRHRFFKSKARLDELNNLSLLKILKIENLGKVQNDLSEFEGEETFAHSVTRLELFI